MSGTPDLDRRTYDLLRLIDAHEPIGSIRLTRLMQQHGYQIEDRTIRLTLANLDETGFTEKIPGVGRTLTAAGRGELDRGNVSGRLERVRERIATLTSQVTYDPTEDAGTLVAGTVSVHKESLSAVFDSLSVLKDSPLGPVPTAIFENGHKTEGNQEDRHGTGPKDEEKTLRLAFPSSITLDGTLLSWGINADLRTAGLVEYREGSDEIVRYIDAINGEGSTMDVVTLLIEASRTDVEAALDGDTGVLVVDNREFPLTRYAEARDLADETASSLGGVVDVRRPRESGPFPLGNPGWEFASLTYGGIAETALALLYERGLVDQWETLAAVRPRSDFHSLTTTEATVEERVLLDSIDD